MTTLIEALGYALAYTVLGIILLAVGYWVIDALTPGKIGAAVFEKRSLNATIVLSAGFVGLGAIVFTAIWTNSASGFGEHLLWTAAFGLFGIVLQALAFLLLEVLTPGKLRELIVEPTFHPAALLAASAQLAVSAIIVASIS